MRNVVSILVVLLFVVSAFSPVILASDNENVSQTPEPTPSPSPTPEVTPTTTSSQTPCLTPVVTSTPTPIPVSEIVSMEDLPLVWEATDPEVYHTIGHESGTDWYATPDDPEGHILYGPYLALAPGKYHVIFRLKVSDKVSDGVCKIEVEHEVGETLKEKTLYGSDFEIAGEFQEFSLVFVTEEAKESVEFRVYYYSPSGAELTVDCIKLEAMREVEEISEEMLPIDWEATDTAIYHAIGHKDGSDWYATADDPDGHILYGPYLSLASGKYNATFRLKVSEKVSDEVCKIEITHEVGETLKEKTLYGSDFEIAGEFQEFSLVFKTDEKKEKVEFRIYYYGHTKLTVDKIKLEEAKVPVYTIPEEIKEEAKDMLSGVKVAVVYQRVTDETVGRSVDDVTKLFKETETDFIFRGWWRWMPCPESPETAPKELLKVGYTYEHLKKAVTTLKKEIPGVIFCGAIPAQHINVRERNPITGETFGKDETEGMAADPAKWGIDMSKEEFQAMICGQIVVKEGTAYFPDITNPEFQALLLSWVKKQIDCGADAIWIDSLFAQAILFENITKDPNHPAVKESFEGASKIVDEIHNYGYSKGKYIIVGTWSGFADLPYSPPNLDFVTMTPTGKEILYEKLDETRWDEAIAKVGNKLGNVPIFAFIDWGHDRSALAIFSQKLNKNEQRKMIITIDGFFQGKGVKFAYPLHGGFMGESAKILSFGESNAYDSLAPEFETVETRIYLLRCESR